MYMTNDFRKGIYNILVPRFDYTGPCNVAVDIGREAMRRGFFVRMLALSGGMGRDDLEEFDDVRLLKWRDFFGLRGVLHTHCLRPDLVGGLIAALGRCTVITTLHNYFLIDLGFDHKRWQVALSWQLWRRSVSAMSHAVCISDAMHRYYKRKMPQARLATAYNFRAAPPAPLAAHEEDIAMRFSPWLKLQRENNRRVLAFVGSIHRRKNVLRLVEAVAQHTNVALVLCGDGPLREELRRMIEELQCGDRVLVLGLMPRPDLILEKVDALTLPSFAEGMPLVVLEAARLGKPSLLSNIAVHREMANLGLGITFDHHRFCDFSQALQALDQSNADGKAVRDVWQQYFAPSIGFARYERLLASDDTKRSRLKTST